MVEIMKEKMGKGETKEMTEKLRKGEMKGVLVAAAGVLGIIGLIAIRKKKSAMEEIKSGCGKEGEMPMMPQMITKMMPHCLEMVLPKLSKEDRNEFVMKIASILFAKQEDKEANA